MTVFIIVNGAGLCHHVVMTLNLDQYRSSREYREILRILQRSSTLQENLIWQSHALGKNIVPIHHYEIDFVSREVVIYYDSLRYKIEKELPLYVKLDYRTSVFKVTELMHGQNTVHFPFPKEIKTQELRVNPRFKFDGAEEKFVALRPIMTTGHRDAAPELVTRVHDISYFGMGLIVSETNRSFLKNNRILWVTRLDHQALDRPVLAEVVYINTEVPGRRERRGQRELKVGLKLSGVLPEDVFNDFIE